MANNRMWLRCKVCEGGFMIAKTMNAGWYYNGPAKEYEERMEKFLDDHDECSFSHDYEDQEIFELIYEVSGDFQYHYEEGKDGIVQVTKLIKEVAR